MQQASLLGVSPLILQCLTSKDPVPDGISRFAIFCGQEDSAVAGGIVKKGIDRRGLRGVGMALVLALTGIAVDDLNAQAPLAASFTVTNRTAGTPLHFVTGLGINPVAQRLTLKNGPGGVLNWKTTVTTTDGAAWLSVKPKKGRTQKNRSRKLNVTVDVITTALPA